MADKHMKVLSLCAGIGGFDLAAEWAGHEVVGQVEIDPFCIRVLEKHWPNVKRIPDLFDVKGDEFGTVDLVTAGFPCQPYSVAGKRGGAADDRAIWPEVFRVITAVRSRWCLLENVPGFIPMALDACLADLEGLGYEAWAIVVPACAVGAWHRRDRVWIVAHAERVREPQPQRSIEAQRGRTLDSGQAITSDAKCKRRDGQPDASPRNDTNGHHARWQEEARRIEQCDWWEFESRFRGVPDGLSTGVAGRVPKLKALGNAIVPQCAYEIIRLMD